MKNIKFSVLAMIVFMALAFTFAGCHPKTPIKPGTEPSVKTGAASQITKTSAVISGKVISDGGSTVTERGVFFSSNGSPTDQSQKSIGGQGTGAFTCNLSSLKENTPYYYMAYARNSLGTAYGDVKSFTTSRDAVLTVTGDSLLKMTSVIIKMNIDPYGSNISEAGVCYSTNHNPTTSDSKVVATSQSGPMDISLTSLEANTRYYVRAYSITSTGTLYSPEYAIWTYAVMDQDGNGYHTVVIASQTWMVENWKCTHYDNGDLIPNVTDDSNWIHTTTGAMCWYNNDRAKYDSVYGAMYNWYAVNDPRGLAPKGWHVPNYNDWEALTKSIGGWEVAGGNIKEKGIKHWKSPNTGATNSSGFTALPGGDRAGNLGNKKGRFIDLTTDAVFWTSDRAPFENSAWATYTSYNISTLYPGVVAFGATGGFSVRLIKDN